MLQIHPSKKKGLTIDFEEFLKTKGRDEKPLRGTYSLEILRKIKVAWMKFAKAVGAFNSRVLLALVFYLFLSPIGLVLRIIRKRPLEMRFRSNLETYWSKRSSQEPEPDRYEKQF